MARPMPDRPLTDRQMSDQEPQNPQPARSELETFGEELRREREIRGISLKEIADATKISKRFLEAIERNDHKTLPAPVFTRGFVREYARYLGLSTEDMVNRYNYAAAGDDRVEKPPALPPQPVLVDTPKKPRPRRSIPPAYARVDGNLILTVLIVAALAAVAWWAMHLKQRRDASDAETTTAPIVAAKPVAPPVTATQPPPVNDDLLRLGISVTANSWVTLEADGKTILNAEMTAGESRSFEAKDEFRFRTIGNAAGLSLTLNQAKVPTLGEEGEVVRDRVFDREALTKLRGEQPQ
jgi:transcriptional regulator with XRE-family HTH domain